MVIMGMAWEQISADTMMGDLPLSPCSARPHPSIWHLSVPASAPAPPFVAPLPILCSALNPHPPHHRAERRKKEEGKEAWKYELWTIEMRESFETLTLKSFERDTWVPDKLISLPIMRSFQWVKILNAHAASPIKISEWNY
jgi:hypothetical protein